MKQIYPWLMAACAMLAMLVSNGLTITGLSVFDASLLKEFGFSLGALKFRDLITLVLTGAVAPFIGILIDRVGVRVLLIAGSILLGLAYLAYSQVTALWQIYAIHVAFAAVLVATGLNVAVILVSQWFVKHRGTAIGIALVGGSLSGVIFAKLNVALLLHFGWRASFEWLALAPVILLIAAVWLVRSPQDKGLPPLGAGTGVDEASASTRGDLTYAQALRTRTFWALALTAGMTFYCTLATVAHLIGYLLDMHYNLAKASDGLGLFFGLVLLGNFLFGLIADHINQKAVFIANQAVMLVGAIILAAMSTHYVWYGIALFGLGWGGMYTLLQLQAVNSFGISAAGKILGTITVIDATGGGLGIWLTGVFHDRTGNYGVAFTVCATLIALTFLASVQFRNERKARLVLATAQAG
ncbi:MAG: MFS transporter [Proteobacteria bacterium]|nr:MFS transporter [Pseudomonadota bacterium]